MRFTLTERMVEYFRDIVWRANEMRDEGREGGREGGRQGGRKGRIPKLRISALPPSLPPPSLTACIPRG